MQLPLAQMQIQSEICGGCGVMGDYESIFKCFRSELARNAMQTKNVASCCSNMLLAQHTAAIVAKTHKLRAH